MKIEKISKKQKEILKFAYSDEETLICDGAVRSGKTIMMITAFVIWATENFDRTNFAICGKTVSNAERNIVRPFQQIEDLPFTLNYKISTRMLTVKCGKKENYFYLFGGKDESSYALIQGLTLAGVLFDEVALMPQSFVDQAIARTLSFKNAKIWFNCNPESPNHWFYTEWITNEERKYKHLHFLMKDNPTLGEDEIKRAESLFTGVFYERYILGRWVRAEGIIFQDLAENTEKYKVRKEDLPQLRDISMGADWGGNGSAHALTCSAIGSDGVVYVLKSSKKQAPDVALDELKDFVYSFISYIETGYGLKDINGNDKPLYVGECNCDHIDVIINSLNEAGRYIFGKTYKPPLADRVYLYSILLATGRLKFVEGETDDLLDEMVNLVYDDKADETIPLDDGSMQLDCYDSFTYSRASRFNYLTGLTH